MLLSIIILNYNKSDLTIKCLESLLGQYKKEFDNKSYEIIVVDNGSEKDDISRLKKVLQTAKYHSAKLIENTKNVGFSSGCNIGAQRAEGDILLFLNNDIEVKDKGLSEMCEYMLGNKFVHILGGKLSNTDGGEQASIGKFYYPINAIMFLLGLQRFGTIDKNPKNISSVDWVKGGCMMIKKEIFRSLNGFDEQIFMYIEDMELCYRAKNKGYGVFFYPHVTILHEDQGSSSRSFAVVSIYQNLLYFYKKHRSRKEYLFIRAIMKSKAFLLFNVGRLINNSYLTQTYEKALKVV